MWLKLKKYGTSLHQAFPCAVGTLSQIQAITAGSRTDGQYYWTVTKETHGTFNKLNLYRPGYDNKYNEEEFFAAIPGLGLGVSDYAHRFLDYFSRGSGYYIPEDNNTFPPCYQIDITENPGGLWYDSININFYGDYTGGNVIVNDGTYTEDPQYFYHAYIQGLALQAPGAEDLYVYGFMVCYIGGDGTNQIYIVWDTSITSANFEEPEADPGEVGFQPIKNIAKYPTGGGDLSGETAGYDTDVLAQPGAPDESAASAVGSGLITIYNISNSQLTELAKCLYSDTLLDAIVNLALNPLDFIISLMIFPCTPSNLGSATKIKLGKWSCAASGIIGALGYDASGYPLTKQFEVFDFGTLTVSEMWHSFLDYNASSFELFLPFIGSVDIPVGEVMNGTINVSYTVDFLTGLCVANVLCTKTTRLASGEYKPQYAQHSYQGNCAIQIPLSNVSYGQMIGSFINAGTAGLTHGISGAVGSVTQSIINGGFAPAVQSKGNITANAGFCTTLYPYITIGRPIPVEPESYQETMGYPSYIVSNLGSCKGLCVCDDINLTGIAGATESELNRIRQLCTEGVYV